MKKIPGIRVAGVLEKILGGALFDDPSSKHHRYIFCHVPDDTQIVADEEVCQLMAFPQIQHQVQHLRLNRNIKSGNRFIRHNHGRTGDQGSRKGNPLTLKLNGPVEAWYEDLGEDAPVAKAD